MTPLDRVELLYGELVEHYSTGRDAELRAAAKLLLVALDRFRTHGGPAWQALLDEYLDIARRDPEKFTRMLAAQRGEKEDPPSLQ
jgi:hypothetical protein